MSPADTGSIPTSPIALNPIAPSWVAIVYATADSLDAELARCGEVSTADHLIVRQGLDDARSHADQLSLPVPGKFAAGRRPWRRITSWWTGQHVDGAWGALHLAGQALIEIQAEGVVKAQLADMAANVVLSFPHPDLRGKDYLRTVQLLAPAGRSIGPADRAQLRLIRQGCDSTADTGHADARSFRNGLMVVGALLGIVLVVVALTGWADPAFRSVFAGTATGTGTDASPGRWYLLELELIGSVSGVTGAVFSLRNYTGFQSAYGLPVVQTFLKGSTGAATGLLGVGLIQSGIIGTVRAETRLGVFGLAVVFGYAQYLFTRLVDKQAETVLKSATSRNAPGTTPEVAAGADKPSLLTTNTTDPTGDTADADGSSAMLDGAVEAAKADPAIKAGIDSKVAASIAASQRRRAAAARRPHAPPAADPTPPAAAAAAAVPGAAGVPEGAGVPGGAAGAETGAEGGAGRGEGATTRAAGSRAMGGARVAGQQPLAPGPDPSGADPAVGGPPPAPPT